MKLYKLLPMLCLAPAIAHAKLHYEVSSIGPKVTDWGRIVSVNNHGTDLGATNFLEESKWFIATGNNVTYLPENFRAQDINDLGVVTGTAYLNGKYSAATYENGQLTLLGGIGHEYNGNTKSRARAINNQGEVAGSVAVSPGTMRPAIFHGDGKITALRPVAYGWGEAMGINDAGAIIGSHSRDGHDQAFLYQDGVLTGLGTLGGNWSRAAALNASGQVVGYSATADGAPHAFLYSGGHLRDLGLGGGFNRSSAIGISDSGNVLGEWGGDRNGIPFLYEFESGTAASVTSLLHNSRWTVATAYAINGSNQIAAKICLTSNDCQYALLSPVPEPATYGMLLGGLGVLALAARRRHQLS